MKHLLFTKALWSSLLECQYKCLYMHIYVCVCICGHRFICGLACMHLYLHVYTCISLHLYLCMFMHMLAGTHMCLHTSLHEHTCILHLCTCVYKCVCVYTQIYVYSHFCVCMHVCMCVHLHADFEPLLKRREHWSSSWPLVPTIQSMSHLAFGKRILQGYLPLKLASFNRGSNRDKWFVKPAVSLRIW